MVGRMNVIFIFYTSVHVTLSKYICIIRDVGWWSFAVFKGCWPYVIIFIIVCVVITIAWYGDHLLLGILGFMG
jgi:hypothetical protein